MCKFVFINNECMGVCGRDDAFGSVLADADADACLLDVRIFDLCATARHVHVICTECY